jgi:CRP/FNR family cyclic AMP-dependent transcriptional regulator
MPGNLFNQLLLFDDLRPEQHKLVRALFIPCEFAADEVIFEQGNPAEFLYLVVTGEVIVRFKPDDGPALMVARVSSEGVVGWSATLGSPTYTSSAVCATPCKLLRVRSDDLRQFCTRHPETGNLVLERLAAVISERLRNTHEHVIALLEQGLRLGVQS